MADTNFVNSSTLLVADWCNDVNDTVYDGATTQLLVGGGATVKAVWTTATGTGAPVRAGGPTFTGNITLSAASAKIIPGVTSLLFRNNADSANNLSITDAGAITIRAGVTITAGGLTVTAGVVSQDDTTESTSTTTGSIHTDGGLGVAKALWVGGLANIAGITTTGGLASTAAMTVSWNISSGDGVAVKDTGDTSSVTFLAFKKAAGTTIGQITRNTTTDAVIYSTTSDYRTKKLFGAYADAAQILSALRVHDGLMNGDDRRRPLVVAHEVSPHMPWAVLGQKDAVDDKGAPLYQQIDYMAFAPMLIAGWQNHESRLVALEAAVLGSNK